LWIICKIQGVCTGLAGSDFSVRTSGSDFPARTSPLREKFPIRSATLNAQTALASITACRNPKTPHRETHITSAKTAMLFTSQNGLSNYRQIMILELQHFCVCVNGLRSGKAVPLQAWSGREGSRKFRFPDFMTTAKDGGKVVSLTHRPPLPPGNTPGTHFS
jgi:hypothetical protein